MTKPIIYQMQRIDEVNFTSCSYKYFLIAAGTDSRAYEVVKRLKEKNVPIENLIAFNFKERIENLLPIEKVIYESYTQLGYNYIIINCSINNVSECIKSFNYGESEDNIGIDISCFTKPYFFSILKFLQSVIKITKINVYYTEPTSYIFKNGIHNLTYHSSSGPLSIIEIPGFSGNESRTKNRLLIFLLGFDGELASYITREEIAPGNTIIINGFPSYNPKFKEISLINNEKLIDICKTDENLYFTRANNPFDTEVKLEEILCKNKDSFINIAPLGTKPMALGACLFALFYPSIRVIYPLPQRYIEKTTKECWQSWRYLINF